ncbi:MAG: stimulus-sensing domain-containing protein, partial [Asticcacaulis sp.]
MPHFSALTWRILGFNALALIVLTAGVILVQFSGRDLVEERLSGVQQQAAIVASAIAEYASDQESSTLNLDAAEPLLRQLISPTRLRARVYLISNNTAALDTRLLLRRNIVRIEELPGLDLGSQIKIWIRRIYDGAMGVRPFSELAPYSEGSGDWHNYQEVVNAFSGQTSAAERVDDQNRLILSVAVPIQRLRAVSGVLFVTTEGGDIDDILRQERFTLIEVFLVAFAVMLVTSLYLASTVAEPVKRLAAAADMVRSGAGGRSD